MNKAHRIAQLIWMMITIYQLFIEAETINSRKAEKTALNPLERSSNSFILVLFVLFVEFGLLQEYLIFIFLQVLL